MTSGNPLLFPFTTPYGAPDFARIAVMDFLPAFDEAMRRHEAELANIAANPATPTFANTIDALELAGEDLDRVSSVFWNLAGTDSTEDIRAIEREMSPKLSAHWSKVHQDAGVFARIEALWDQADKLGLSVEQAQVLKKIRTRFIKGGAKLDAAGKARATAIQTRLSELGTAFGQNVLKDETDWSMELSEGDLAGLPAFLVSAARAEAQARGLSGYAITLSRSSVEPFLTFSTRADLRARAYAAWAARGDAGATDNKPLVAEMLKLRAEYARLLGYRDFADMKLADTMAKRTERAAELLETVWAAGKRRAAGERDELLVLAREDGLTAIAPADWRHYAEKLRQNKHALDEAVIKPFFQLEKMIEASFDCATRLFGLTFTPAPDAPIYHPDVRAFDVRDAAGQHVALFYGDYFARPGKRSGAWMSGFRDQKKLGGEVRPIVTNVMNFVKPAMGQPALLSFDDARTLFHEFGHALHGMLTDVTYPSLAGTSVPRDFVELPSQLYEHWLDETEVLSRFAIHAETGAAMPADLLARLLATRTFNQGFITVEYCASALVDLAFHTAEPESVGDIAAFEAATLKRIGMPAEIGMRHRTPHFQHIFSGDGYAAGYYSYLWSEVLDADAFRAFKDAGDIFHAATAARLKANIYAAGHSRDPDDAYVAFRGRLPAIDALLEKRGLKAA